MMIDPPVGKPTAAHHPTRSEPALATARRAPGLDRQDGRGRCAPSQSLQPFLSVEKRRDLLDLADVLEAGQLQPVIDRTYPLSGVAEALRYVGAGHTRGKVVVTF